MLSSSSKALGDVGDTLSTFFKETQEKDRQEKVAAEIRALRKTLKSLKRTEEKLIEKLAEQNGKNFQGGLQGGSVEGVEGQSAIYRSTLRDGAANLTHFLL